MSRFIFSTYPQAIPLKQLGRAELSNYAVVGSSGSETLLNYYLEVHQTNPPWKSLDNNDELIEYLEKRRIKYGITYEPLIMNELKKHKKCDSVYFYDTIPKSNGLFGVFYFGSSINNCYRLEVNKAVAKLVASRKIDKIVNFDTEQGGCGRRAKSIYPQILLVALVLPLTIATIFLWCVPPLF